MRKGVLALIAVVVFAFLCMIPKLGEDMDKKQIGINQIPFTGTLEYWTNGGFQFQKMGTVICSFLMMQKVLQCLSLTMTRVRVMF